MHVQLSNSPFMHSTCTTYAFVQEVKIFMTSNHLNTCFFNNLGNYILKQKIHIFSSKLVTFTLCKNYFPTGGLLFKCHQIRRVVFSFIGNPFELLHVIVRYIFYSHTLNKMSFIHFYFMTAFLLYYDKRMCKFELKHCLPYLFQKNRPIQDI